MIATSDEDSRALPRLRRGSRFRMADDLLDEYLRQLTGAHAGAPEVAVARQGGEPTTMGLHAAADPRRGRNDPCPCGSGRKRKRCHLAPVGASREAAPP